MINTMSPRQAAFVLSMLAEIFADAPAGSADAILARNIDRGLFADRNATRASIDALIAKRDAFRADRRKATPAAAPACEVTPGYYAVEYSGVMRFYKVVAGKGKWAGRTFVNRYKSDDEMRVSRTESNAVLALIAADQERCGERFAELLTRCRRCGRMLTDLPTAKINGGFGPECVKMV